MKHLLAVLLCLMASVAQAMTYTTDIDPDTGRVRLFADGDITPDELDAFGQALVLALGQTAPENPYRPLVVLESYGGNPVAAMQMGRLIRDAGLDTFVPEGGIGCHSACTLAFLGGVKRRIEGVFGIHAVRANNSGLDLDPLSEMQQGFDLQWIAADQIAYARDMLGDDRLILAALQLGYTDTIAVGDAELSDWGVITVATRPGQYLPVGTGLLSYCASPVRPEGVDLNAFGWLCSELDLARTYREIELLTDELAGDSRAEEDLAQADRFNTAWQGCAGVRFSDATPEAMDLARTVATDRRVPDCIGTVLATRRAQLAAIRDYIAVVDSPQARGWIELE